MNSTSRSSGSARTPRTARTSSMGVLSRERLSQRASYPSGLGAQPERVQYPRWMPLVLPFRMSALKQASGARTIGGETRTRRVSDRGWLSPESLSVRPMYPSGLSARTQTRAEQLSSHLCHLFKAFEATFHSIGLGEAGRRLRWACSGWVSRVGVGDSVRVVCLARVSEADIAVRRRVSSCRV